MNNKRLLRRDIAHFGTIAFNYSAFGLGLILSALLSTIVITLLAVFGGLFGIFYFFILIMITLFSLGLLLLAEEFRGLWEKGADYFDMLGNMGSFASEHIFPFLVKAIPIASIVILILSVVSFICMMFDRKWEKSKPRLVFLGIVIVLLILLIIALFTGILIIGGAK